ncbi:TRAP transporter substrate-binding protein [Pararhodobacter aggregans]|uniref:C4-dicarboxylate ABC transporter substrate-binding protein n=1 Tax=Pararhodobacter aggregans TaxID=404875 RepID=A0A2T7UXA5_9RHOB|nr:TRAP transporter substrate-binding protein [Pararhodobacter aggregans]PTX04993.1 TRAP-type C4-dicarboxylate transport system substrate-binding protein [Pararhodobacter aggregans]PVE49312.1 C4-dicarboxylate ABC transporter substrate-binding protein [Pararhodobacter aggregans]
MLDFTTLRTAGAALAAAAVLAAPATATTLRLAHWVPPQHTLTASTIEPLQAAVSGAGVEIQVYPGGELGAGPLEQYVRAVTGVADIVWGLQGYTSSQFPRTMISELPGALPEGVNGYDMLWNAQEAGLLDGEFPGTRPLALWLSEPNVFIMRDHDIRTPADVAGLKIRVSGSAAAAAVEALGATPVQMPAGEIYNALQTGLIDGVITGASAIGDFRLDEVANSYTLGAPLGRISFYLVMNQGAYDGLSDDERAALDAIAGRALSQSAEEGWNARAQQVIDQISATGDNTVYTLTPEEAEAFAALTLPVRDAVVATVDGGAEVLSVMQGQ